MPSIILLHISHVQHLHRVQTVDSRQQTGNWRPDHSLQRAPWRSNVSCIVGSIISPFCYTMEHAEVYDWLLVVRVTGSINDLPQSPRLFSVIL